MKTYCIGDLHGNYKGLIQAIDRSPFNPKEDKLITLGDYIDGGEHIEVLPIMEYLLELPNWEGVIGNHDFWMLETINEGWMYVEHIWYTQGGRQTLNSMGIGTSKEESMGISRILNGDCPEVVKKFLRSLHLYYEQNNMVFVHAGWSSMSQRIEESWSYKNKKADLYWVRDFWYSANKSELPPYDKVFIGHTQDLDNPRKRGNVWNLDSGAGGIQGKVTVMDVDSEEFWQSDKTIELYPNASFR